jgi:hypothetical protein
LSVWVLLAGGVRGRVEVQGCVRGRPSLTSVLGLGWLPAGYMMCDGVFRQMCCGRSVFLGRVRVGGSAGGLGELAAVHRFVVGLPRDT